MKTYKGFKIYKEGYVWCPACQRWLPREAFHKNASKENGLQAYCKAHQIAYVQNYYWNNIKLCKGRAKIRRDYNNGHITFRQMTLRLNKLEG